MLFNLLFLAILFLLTVAFCIGLILFLIGILKKNKSRGLIVSGAIVGGIPLSLLICYCIYYFACDLVKAKPDYDDLVGEYRISNETMPGYSMESCKDYKLTFNKDGSYVFIKPNEIDVPDSGTFSLDYSSVANEIILQKHGWSSTCCINRHVGYFEIEFFIGDPDSGESFFFRKNE